MDAYDWSEFHLWMYYLAPRAEVFRRFATAAGLQSFYIHQARHVGADGDPRAPDEMVQSGDRYEWTYVHDFAHGGTFHHVVEGSRVQFTFGPMTVDIRFRDAVDGATEVHLHQTGCATDDPDRAWQHVNCRSCWIYFLTNLRSVLAGGPDVRDHAHPEWNDSIGIGFNPEAGPGTPRR